MKRFFGNILIIFGVFAAFLALVNQLQGTYNHDPSHYRLQYQEAQIGAKQYEGIIMGTSHCTHAIVPSILDKSGIQFYNFALNGSNPEFYYNWYNRVFLQNNNKQNYCILGIDWFIFDKERLWRELAQDSEYFKEDLFHTLALSKEYATVVSNRFPAFKYRKGVFSSLVLKKGNKSFPLEKYDRGYIPYTTSFDSSSFKVKTEVKIDTSRLIYFTKLVAQLHEKKVNIIFVMTPEYGIPSEEYKKMKSLQLVNKIAKEFNISFLNFNTSLRSDFNENMLYFSDWGHLSEEGSRVFSQKLSNEIASLVEAKAYDSKGTNEKVPHLYQP